MKILITCPPMLGMVNEFRHYFEEKDISLLTPNVIQTLTEEQLKEILPEVDGWIIGDDPATEAVFKAGQAGKLKAAVKWGVGVDNVDMDACKRLGIPITNTPNMFGAEVAGIAVAYVIGLARQTFLVDRGVRDGKWLKPPGISLAEKKVALIGFGDIGKATAKRLFAFDMPITVYDPYASKDAADKVKYTFKTWPEDISQADFIVITCALTPTTIGLINSDTLSQMKDGVRIVNVSRGPIIQEAALVAALKTGKVHSAALDVFETEPLPSNSQLREFDRCIFGTHNGSNTEDGVRRASHQAIRYLFDFLNVE